MNTGLKPAELGILGALLRAKGQPVDPGFLTHEYAAGPEEIGRCVGKLIRHGSAIECDMQSVRLIRSGLGVWADYLQHTLAQKYERAVEVYQTTASTQDLARPRARESLLILADEQTAGRGRLGRRWLAPRGTGLLFSMTHRLSPDHPDSIDRLSFLTAVALAQAIERITGRGPIQIRWPNDLYVDRCKLAGILVETVRHTGDPTATAVIGVGINVGLTREHLADMPPRLRSRVTSFDMLGWRADRLHIAEQVISQIDRNLHDTHVPLLVEEWRGRNLFRAQTIRLNSGGKTITGTVIDLDPDDGLIVRRDTGEIVHLPAATTTVL